MLNAILREDMIELLKDLKNSKFISYECGKIFNCVGGNLRINTSNGSIEIGNIEKPMIFFDENDEVAFFECKKVDSDARFQPYCDVTPERFEIGETITGIEIINDYANVNNGEYEFSFDQAIIIKTQNTVTMFSRDMWFSEVITVSDNDNYDALFPISKAAESFSDYGEHKVDVRRTRHEL